MTSMQYPAKSNRMDHAVYKHVYQHFTTSHRDSTKFCCASGAGFGHWYAKKCIDRVNKIGVVVVLAFAFLRPWLKPIYQPRCLPLFKLLPEKLIFNIVGEKICFMNVPKAGLHGYHMSSFFLREPFS